MLTYGTPATILEQFFRHIQSKNWDGVDLDAHIIKYQQWLLKDATPYEKVLLTLAACGRLHGQVSASVSPFGVAADPPRFAPGVSR